MSIRISTRIFIQCKKIQVEPNDLLISIKKLEYDEDYSLCKKDDSPPKLDVLIDETFS